MKTEANGRTIFNSWDARDKDGLTKRELFASEIMASLVRRASMVPDENYMREFARYAVAGADALVKELNKEK